MAEHLTSLKRSTSEDGIEVPEKDFFPHSLFLDEDDIEKLKVDDLELGDERQLVAVVRVTSISSNESERGGKRRDMTLVLTEGEIMRPNKSQSERIFGGGDGGDK